MSKDKILYEFYYEIGDHGPKAKYQLNVDKITDKMYYGTVTRVNSKGEYLYDCGRFRIYQDDANTAELDYSAKKPTVKIRIDVAELNEATTVANKMAGDYLRELASRISQGGSDLPIKIGDTLYKICTDPLGCRACPNGLLFTHRLCPYTCPESQFRIETVIVESIPQVCDLTKDGKVVLKDKHCLSMEDAQKRLCDAMIERKQNKLAFEKMSMQ